MRRMSRWIGSEVRARTSINPFGSKNVAEVMRRGRLMWFCIWSERMDVDE